MASHDDLELADVYFKRGYDAASVGRLPPHLSRKVHPFGLQFACSSPNETLWDVFAGHYLQYRRSTSLLIDAGRAAQRFGRAAGRHLLSRLSPRFHNPMRLAAFENDPGSAVSSGVFFRTRVYSPADAPGAHRQGDLQQLNEMRANVVRALRRAFGNRFAGGIRDSDFARSKFPDCVMDRRYGHAQHIQETKTHLVNVSTMGLHNSTGWKLAEFFAASSCIVCEPPRQGLPDPLIAGKHYLDSPARMSACQPAYASSQTGRWQRGCATTTTATMKATCALIRPCFGSYIVQRRPAWGQPDR